LKSAMQPQYRLPGQFIKDLMWAVVVLQPRSFAGDARLAISGISPAIEVCGSENIPQQGACLITCNHYHRPGFAAWWLALGISAVVASYRDPLADGEIRWVMTAALTFPESKLKHLFLTPVTRWFLRRIAHVYSFVTMPAMPPDPHEVQARAAAIRQTIRLARQAVQTGGMLGLAPQGMDTADNLGQPPTGAGAFIALLVDCGLPVLPVGVSEQSGRFRICFQPPFIPDIPRERSQRDLAVASQVMRSITK